MTSEITEIDYNDLLESKEVLSDSLLEKIGKGFGNFDDSLGIIIVKNIPEFQDLRQKLLRLSHQLATCTPKETLDELTIANANYQVGWSHGQERVEGEDKFDTAKGSYYANPLSDDVLSYILERDFPSASPNEEDDSVNMKKFNGTKEEFIEIAKENPAFFASNVWPVTLPELEQSFKQMGLLIRTIGKLVGNLCDEYVLKGCPEYTPNKINEIIDKSMCCKGRLLHYFPMNSDPSDVVEESSNKNDIPFSDWCGWHNDHCSLTGLVPAMYIDSNGNEIECPDPSAGLYIKSRKGDVVHVKIPTDALAFQIGETAQIHTGGLLQATPHAVRGCNQDNIKSHGVSREAFALFMEPEFHGDMNIPKGKGIEDAQCKESETHLPSTVKTLRSRWRPGMSFGEFSNATFAAFY